MKKFTILLAFALTMATTTAFSFEGNLGPPIENEQITFADIVDQNDVYVSLGWNAEEVAAIEHESGMFVFITYNQGDTDLGYASPIVSDYSSENFTRFKENILKIPLIESKPKINYKSNNGVGKFGSAGGLPYTYAVRVAHA